MFVDYVTIKVKAGDGGDGVVSFHREKYVVNGGPDGGDGGNGGSIIFEATDNVHTLLDFRFHRKFFADNGERGSKKRQRGKSGADICAFYGVSVCKMIYYRFFDKLCV